MMEKREALVNMLHGRVAGVALGLALSIVSVAPIGADAQHWVCPPCNAPCDARVFDRPGVCPECGMTLVEQGAVPAQPARRKVGILIFNGVEIIDYTGPWEMFGDAGFEVYTVALDRNPITTAMGMTVIPKYTLADAPLPDVLLVPGGGVKGTCDNAATLAWLRQASARSEKTLSVCNGAFILASAGLLDGLKSTTTAHNIERMRKTYPKVTVVDDQRVVDNGKIITAGGLSSGIDGALHVIDTLLGHGTASQVALDQEYDWRPDGGFVRSALADMEIPQVDLDAIGDFHLVSTAGDRRRWDIVVQGRSKLTPPELGDHIRQELEQKGHWRSETPARAAASARTPGVVSGTWSFTGRDGGAWRGELTIEPPRAAGQDVTARLTVARSG